MKISKFAAWASAGGNAAVGEDIRDAGDDGGVSPPEPPPGFDGEEERGRDLRQHRDESDRNQVVGPGDPEDGRVQVRGPRGLAVDGVDVEPSVRGSGPVPASPGRPRRS